MSDDLPSEPVERAEAISEMLRLTAEILRRDAAVAELAALKARRCDGCKHHKTVGPVWIRCKILGCTVPADHACNAWTPPEPPATPLCAPVARADGAEALREPGDGVDAQDGAL